ncbi:MAG: crotonase/enoyl-CoA hydratase family protein [Gammaproteobacteria bacterium]|nr:crotonase/enoyl-CoA hydratase family protein [Gammaproteobacteria bacterium]NNC97805.1 crotonase/enoyl-CoA hydratase family protein [Gammaproteobacteria bacterium]NNM13732.1 crotonase/enoyl-CoA hydratase family protein [Gammaproteobacteria bacterium]
MSELVNYAFSEGIATVTLQNGKANALSSQVFTELNAAFDQAEKDKAVVVLTSEIRMLSGGYDLKEMANGLDAIKNLVLTGSRFTQRMLNFPLPIIVAVPGHCIAKAAFITMSADYAIGVEGHFKIGLNETAIGMTMHNVGIELARYSLSKRYFRRSVLNAEIYGPIEAVEAGFLDMIVQEENLVPSVKQVAEQFTKLDLTAFGISKQRTNRHIVKLLDECIEQDLKDPVYFKGA